MRHLASATTDWRHPADDPPPLGTKLLLWMHTGVIAIGQWQHSGASLWAPLLKVPQEMKDRVYDERERKKQSSATEGPQKG